MPTRSYRGMDRAAVKAEFARRLQHRLDELSMSQADLTRACQRHLPTGKFGRDSASLYTRGRALPNRPHLQALAKALKCDETDLLPTMNEMEPLNHDRMPFAMESTEDGLAYLRVNQAVPWDVALRVAQILHEAGAVADKEERSR